MWFFTQCRCQPMSKGLQGPASHDQICLLVTSRMCSDPWGGHSWHSHLFIIEFLPWLSTRYWCTISISEGFMNISKMSEMSKRCCKVWGGCTFSPCLRRPQKLSENSPSCFWKAFLFCVPLWEASERCSETQERHAWLPCPLESLLGVSESYFCFAKKHE